MADLVTRRARLVVAGWILVVAVLAMLGRGLGDELKLHPIYVDGTQSKLAHDIAVRGFGGEYAIIVMLRGPERAVAQQGRRLANRLDRLPRLLVVSPWDASATVEGLTPEPGVAAIVVRSRSVEGEDVMDLLPPVERQIEASVSRPVRSSIAGFPAIADSLLSANEEAVKTGELIALPVLVLVLLLVFRSVLAALMPVLIGGAVVAASQGMLRLLLEFVDLDLFALGVVGMMGLALGVDYSLLVVSRFREERQGLAAPEAARLTMQATSRSVVPAGCGLLLAMLAAALVLPGQLTTSVAIAVAVATVLSMVSALCVVPALLALFGSNLDRWSIPGRGASQAAPLRWSRRLSGHPRAIASIMVLLLFLSAWAFTLDSGSASVEFLPPEDPGRLQQEEVAQVLGPGWVAPMEVVVDGRGKPLTSPRRLRAMAAFERRVERDPGVQAMAGFEQIERGARRVRGIEDGLAEQQRGLDRLDTGIARVHDGAKLNTSGLLQAAEGARGLSSGIGAADAGSNVLAEALEATSSGSRRLTDGLSQADEGGGRLAEGTADASSGAARLAEGLEKAREGTGEIQGGTRLLENAIQAGDERLAEVGAPLHATGEQLGAAWQALQRMTSGRSDPEYAEALRAVEEASRQLGGTEVPTAENPDSQQGGVAHGIERARGQLDVGSYLTSKLKGNGRRARDGIAELARGSAQLDRGLRRLASGSRRLSRGLATLSRSGERIPSSLKKLNDGAERLASGLHRLEDGSDQLAGGLGGGAQKSKLLTGALRRIGLGLERREDGEQGGSGLDRLQQQSPGLFQSSYFVLAALDGSKPERRAQLGSLLSLGRGGQYGRMLVIPRHESTSAEASETKRRLEGETAELGRKTGATVALGGVAPATIDADNALRAQALDLRLALSLVSFLILVPVVRSLTLPLLAALLNLLSVSAAFGLLSFLFNTSLLGGPGYVDSTMIPATIIVLFGLAIDYEVFVFARIREEYVRTGSTSAAVRIGLDRTAHVITGAAVIMIAVFLAFSVAALMPLRNFGVAQAIGIFIDAFIIRLLVIPAAMARLGRWSWWMPRWLDRLLPGGPQVAAAPSARGA